MQDLLHYFQDSADHAFLWVVVGFLFFEALVLFLMARRWADREIHIGRGGVRIRGRNAQVNTGVVGGDMIQNNHDAGGKDADRISLGLVFNIAASLSSIAGLALAVFLALQGP